VEGRDFVIEFRVADGKYDRLPGLAAELVRLKVDVIVTGGTPGTRAAKQASAAIPIVMAISGDAVATGLVASLARPGGNVTGSTYFDPELHEKRLELLKEAVPRITRVGALINPDNPQAMGTTLQALRRAAESLKMELPLFEARSPSEFEGAFSAMAKRRVDAVAIVDDPMFLGNLRAIADLAASKRLPSTGAKEFAEAGGLIGYGVDFVGTFRRAAYFVDRILKGTKPGDLPVEQATRFELVINRKAARALALNIPEQLLYRADKLIE
jgi:putative ABC transport system substrate-binding protein